MSALPRDPDPCGSRIAALRRSWSRSALGVLCALCAARAGALELAPWAAVADRVRADGPAVVRVPTAALLLSGEEGGALAVDALAVALPRRDGGQRVTVLTEVGLPLAASADAASADAASAGAASADGERVLEHHVYVLDADRRVAASTSSVTTLAAPLPRRGLVLPTVFDLPPGRYTLRVLARVPANGALGLVSRRLEVPAPDTETLSPPLVLAPLAGRRVVLPPAGDALDADALRPIRAGGALALPAARPVLETPGTAPARVSAETPGASTILVLAPPLGDAPARLVARFERGGALLAETPVEPLERRPAPWPGREWLAGTCRVPELPAGGYRLRLTLHRPGKAALVSPALPVRVEPGARPERRAARARPERAPRRGDVERRYRDVLRLLAAGSNAAAGAALVELETAFHGREIFRKLARTEWRVLERLARGGWAPLLPVVALHVERIADYETADQTPLAEHSRRLARRLARALAGAAATPDERSDAARALDLVAKSLVLDGRLPQAEELLEESLRLDPESVPTHLELGMLRERRARYAAAADALEKLVALDPAHLDGRLRLAFNQLRAGEPDRARPHLDFLREAPTPRWIGVLTAQASAGLAIAEDRPDDAVRLLERALARWPDEPSLALQLASLLDRLGSPRAARARIRALAPAPDREAARYRYQKGTSPALARRRLAERARRHRAELARRLEPADSRPGKRGRE